MQPPLPPVRVFRPAFGRQALEIVVLLAGLVILPGLAWLTVNALLSSSWLPLILFLPAIGLMAVGVYAGTKDLTSSLTIHDDGILYRNLFSKKSWPFTEILGYRILPSGRGISRGTTVYIYVREGKRGEISLSNPNDLRALNDWLAATFTNLDEKEYAEGLDEILDNPRFGRTREERVQNLHRAERIARVTNISGVVIALAFLFVDLNPYLSAALILYVPVTFFIVATSNGMIYFNNKTNSPHPYVTLGLFFVCFASLFRGVFDYHLLHYAPAFRNASILAAGLVLFMLGSTSEFAKRSSLDIANIFALLFMLLLFSFGVYTVSNGVFDTSRPQKFATTIIGKQINEGSYSDSFTVKFIPAGPVTDDKADISHSFYQSLEVNDTIRVCVKQGLWGSQWFFVEDPGR